MKKLLQLVGCTLSFGFWSDLAKSASPGFARQPAGAVVPAHGTMAISATVTGSPPISLQWYRNGSAIANATSSALVIINADETDGGEHVLVASNSFGVAESDSAVLTVQRISQEIPRYYEVLDLVPLAGSAFTNLGEVLSMRTYDINNRGDVVGQVDILTPRGSFSRGFVFWASNSSIVDVGQLSAPPDGFPFQPTWAQSMNDLGQIVGTEWLVLSTNADGSIRDKRQILFAQDQGIHQEIADPSFPNSALLGPVVNNRGNVLHRDRDDAWWIRNLTTGSAIALPQNSFRTLNDWDQAAAESGLGEVLVWSENSIVLRSPGHGAPRRLNNTGLLLTENHVLDLNTNLLGAPGCGNPWEGGLNNLGRAVLCASIWKTNQTVGINQVESFGLGSSGYRGGPMDANDLGQFVTGGGHLATPMPPRITQQPLSRVLLSGTDVQLQVRARGALGYQWYFNGTTLPSQSSSNLIVSSFSQAYAGGYSVVLSNITGLTTSMVASLSLLTPPIRTTIGTSGDPAVAGSLTILGEGDFDVVAGGSDIWGAADHFEFVHEQQSGDFDVKVRIARLDNTAYWAKAGLMVRENLTPGSRNILLTIAPTNGANVYGLNYRDVQDGEYSSWPGSGQSAGVPLPNAWMRLVREGHIFRAYRGIDGANWTLLTDITKVFPGCVYLGVATCAVNNNAPSGTIAEYRGYSFSSVSRPSILVQPQSIVVSNGLSAVFSVETCGSRQTTYQWRFAGTNMPGASSGTLVLTNVDLGDDGQYDVVISNPNGAVTSQVATLTVLLAPTIVAQPVHQTVSPGDGVILTVGVYGSSPLTYQWRLNGTNIPGATNVTLVVSNVGPNSVGAYSVHVSNSSGGVTSDSASVSTASLQMFAGVIVDAPTGAAFRIDVREALSPPNSWQPLTNITVLASPYIFIDFDSPGRAKRFYRAVPLQ